MTFRTTSPITSDRPASTERKSIRGLIDRLRDKRNRQNRRMLAESLEQRQLLAGLDLIGVQSNEGDLIRGGEVLQVAPREIVFRFDDQSDLDPAKLADGIRITRAGDDGGFESATATTDLQSNGQVLLEFRASTMQPGAAGNGIEVRVSSSDRGTSAQAVLVSVDEADRVISINLNSNTTRPATVRDLLTAVSNNTLAGRYIEVNQVSGPSQFTIGRTVSSRVDVVLAGANAAQFVTDLGTSNQVRARFVSQVVGQEGVGTTIVVAPGTSTRVTVSGKTINVTLPTGATAADLVQAINTSTGDNGASNLVFAQLELGNANTVLANRNLTFSLVGATDTVVRPGFVGLGNTPHEVVFRFADDLPQDKYQIDVFGAGLSALTNLAGEAVNGGQNVTRLFSLNQAPQVAAVVPTPVTRRADGTLEPAVNVIEVYFNNDTLNQASATTPANYQLIYTRDTATNLDDRIVLPNAFGTGASNSSYDPVRRVARLVFTDPLSRMRDPNNASQFLTGTARLRIGSSQTTIPAAPTSITVPTEPGDSFASASTAIGSTLSTTAGQVKSVTLSGTIQNPSNYDLSFPGGSAVPGVRDIRPDDPSRIDGRAVPLDVVRNADGDTTPGISTVYYDFPLDFQADDPTLGGLDTAKRYINSVTEEQKQRVREVLSLYSQYLGVQFVESGRINGLVQDPGPGQHISITVGDLYGAGYLDTVAPVFSETGGVTVLTRPLDASGQTFAGRLPTATDTNNLLIMDFQDFDESTDDQLGGEFFRGAFLGIGQLLGYGYADNLPQPVTQSTQSVLNPSGSNEALYPSPSDIVTGQFLYKPESNDIDLYRFQLSAPGSVSIQTVAQRLETSSLLDTTLRLYKQDASSPSGWIEIAANDNYFSNDSSIELSGLSSGSYMIGVSASGNSVYDPAITGTGIGGLSQGDYELRMTFEADANAASGILDSDALQLDGDADGEAGGEFNFWFQPFDLTNVLFVDSAYTGTVSGVLGTSTNPYREIDQAINGVKSQIAAAGGATITRQIRIVGGGQYEVGLTNLGAPLKDGADIDLPKGTQLIVDAGSTFLMQRSRIGVGSTTDASTADKSQTSIQVLGTPEKDVVFRSFNSVPDFDLDELAGVTVPRGFQFTAPDPANNGQLRVFRVDLNTFRFDQSFVPVAGLTRLGANPAVAGDWGGIDLRGDIDKSDDSRIDYEELGVFLNHIQYADIRYGGGSVSVDGNQAVVSPIEMASTRATVINSRITNSADAAIAASPDSFAETRFDEFRFQRDGKFTPDFSRVGPHIRGNEIVDNSINGLFIRIETRTGENLAQLNVNARFDDTDIVHVLTENLLIEGKPGGPDATTRPPSILQVNASAQPTGGSVPAGNYDYVVTFVNRDGYETAPSARIAVNNVVAGGSVAFSSLPTLTTELRDLGFTGRRVYRAVRGSNTFVEVGQLNSNDRNFVDNKATGTTRTFQGSSQIARLNPGLSIDPGTIVKLSGARIEATFGAHFYAEGTAEAPVVLTSLADNRYGAGGTFDTNKLDQSSGSFAAGDWSGVYIAYGADASFDHAVLAGGGGTSRIEGGFASFNVIEVQQGGLRVANSRFEMNDDGRSFINNSDDVRADRVGRGINASGTIFVRGAQPVIVNTDFIDGKGAAMSFDINSFSFVEVTDHGRSTGELDVVTVTGNSGPLLQGNRIGATQINQSTDGTLSGLEVRGGTVATEVVFDDTDLVHIIRDMIEIPNQTVYGGLRLKSDARGSLVVKFENQDLDNADVLQRRQAGIVVGGTLVTSEDQFADIADRIGGSLQVVGHPDFPVVLTSLLDDTVGAGFTPDGKPNVDSDNNGINLDENGDPIFIPTSGTSTNVVAPPPGLPLSPEYDRTNNANVDNANVIDDDIDPANYGYFSAGVGYGSEVLDSVDVTYLQPNAAGGPGTLQTLANLEFLYTTFIDVDTFSPVINPNPAPVSLAATLANAPNPVLIGDDRVRSTGTFYLRAGDINPATPNNAARRPVTWVAESFFVNNRATLYTTLTFATEDGGTFTDSIVSGVTVISYLDQGIVNDNEDVLYQKGTPGQADFRAITVNRDATNRNLGPLIGFSHGGIYQNDLINQQNATYLGWAANDAAALAGAGFLDAVQFSINGTIQNTLLNQPTDPPIDGQTIGTNPLGVGDIGTAFAWRLDGNSQGGKITSLVEFLPSDPANPFSPSLPPAVDGSGSWDGVTIREAASDSNIYITGENEPRNLGNGSVNDPNSFVDPSQNNGIPGQAQFLGELAPSVTAGDNQRRLGFIVDGAISSPSDLDVFSFVAEAGTQVWLDIDRTNSKLDTVVELIDTNGNVRVLSDNSLTETAGTTNRLVNAGAFDASSARSLNSNILPATATTRDFQDLYSTNPKDAGMRVVLPGNVGQRFLYHVRVRSNNSASPSSSSLLNPTQVLNGKTSGSYQLQVRLQEQDVFAGTQLRYSDVRYAVNGVQILGGPGHSPLTGDEFETASGNDSITNAQRLGLYETQYDTLGQLFFDRNVGAVNADDPSVNVLLENPAGPLSSDNLAKSISGFIDGATDVDWYQFDIGYDKLTRDDAALLLSTIFDVDYVDGLARPDTAIYVFDAAGQLILVGRDSNIADDQASSNVDFSDLSRGSFGGSDPFIGSAELVEGTYYLAISNQTFIPDQLDQFTNPTTATPLVRVEPVESITRIVEDRIERGVGGTPLPGITVGPAAGSNLLFDFSPTGNSIVDFTLDDVLLYVNSGSSLFLVNPYTGVNYGEVGAFSTNTIEDIAFRNNGELFGYRDTTFVTRNDTSLEYYRIDTGNASLSAPLTQGANLSTFEATVTVATDPVTGVVTNTYTAVPANSGFEVEALTIANFAGSERGFFVGRRAALSQVAQDAGAQYSTNILYGFTPTTGDATGGVVNFTGFLSGAGMSPREIGQIDTTIVTPNPSFGNLLTQLGISATTAVDSSGRLVPVLFDGERFTISDFSDPVNRNSVTFEFDSGASVIAQAGVSIPDGQTLTVDSTVFEFNTGERLRVSSPIATAPDALVGSTVTVSDGLGTTVTFEFVRNGNAQAGRTPIRLTNANDQLLTANALAASLANAINVALPNLNATSLSDVITFSGATVPTVTTSGPAVTKTGSSGFNSPTAIPIDIRDTVNPTVIINRLQAAAASANLATIVSGTQLVFATTNNVLLSASTSASGLVVNGAAGVDIGNIPILVRPGDSQSVIAQRIAEAIGSATDSGDLFEVSAIPAGAESGSLTIVNGEVTGINGQIVDNISPAAQRDEAITAGGARLGGTVTGTEVVSGQSLYAVTNLGELYRVDSGALGSSGARTIGTQVVSATDLIGIPFTGLRSGPTSYNDGELRQILFGVTGNGDVYAFNTDGELQPIFAGGRSMISTGIADARGLDFSTVGFNLWHTTDTRGSDDGHGIDPLSNQSRVSVAGNTSLAFNYEANAFNSNYPSAAEFPAQINLVNGTPVVANPRQDGTTVNSSFNVPGGAKGAVQSSTFSLEGYAAADVPMLYFSYFLDNDGNDSTIADTDSLRVYLVDEQGIQHLVATNNLATSNNTLSPTDPLSGLRLPDDEFDNPLLAPYSPDIDVDVQPLFDNSGSWRQARVPLGPFAGQSNLSLRIEFASAGSAALTRTLSINATAGSTLSSGDTFVIGGETFAIDLAPTISVPTGAQLASLYVDPAQKSVITIDGQKYVLNDGSRTIAADEISVPVATSTAQLRTVNAETIAQALRDTVAAQPPVSIVTGISVADPQDTVPNTGTVRNDRTVGAVALPYNGGNMVFQATGQLGNDTVLGQIGASDANVVNLDDVDLLRINVTAGTKIDVNLTDAASRQILSTIRFFNDLGEALSPDPTSDPNLNQSTYTATTDGTIFIGVSGRGNGAYDPVTGGGTVSGQGVGRYNLSIEVNEALDLRRNTNLVELGGLTSVTATPFNLFVTDQPITPAGIPVSVSRYMSATEVGSVVRQAIADTFYSGDITLVPTGGTNIRLPLLSLDNSGPFADVSQRFGDPSAAGQVAGTRNNNFEGVYLDDFIIGFAERGESVTSAGRITQVTGAQPTANTGFNQQATFVNPAPQQPTVPTNAAYQIEIRDGSEYISSGLVRTNSSEIPLQRVGSDPIVLPINGKLYGFRDAGTPLPAAAVIDKSAANRPQFSALNLPTVDMRTLAGATGNTSLINVAQLGFELIELDNGFKPIARDATFSTITEDRYFQSFDTNDRLSSGFTLTALPGSLLIDGASFEIADSQGQLTFEFDVDNSLNNPAAIRIPFSASDSVFTVAEAVITAINAPGVQALLDVEATRANLADTADSRINLYGQISVSEIGNAFEGVVAPSERRGDANRDRTQQGTVIVENSRFLLGAASGVEITRSATARVLSQDARDALPIALSYPQNLLELNTEGLLPGAVIQNNVFAYNADNGILIQGLVGGGGSQIVPVGFDQVVNNTLIGGVVDAGDDPGPQIFGDYLFGHGGISFADAVIAYSPGADVDSDFTNTDAVLSTPDDFGPGLEPSNGRTTLSLGTRGSVTLLFTNNFLTGNNSSTPDLVVFETGSSESVRVEISRDGVTFFDVGTADALRPEIDIDRFGFTSADRFAYVRLTDLDTDGVTNSFGAAGADIDSVGALSTVPAFNYTPGSQGIVVKDNSGPTLLNNIVANFQTGIAVSGVNPPTEANTDRSRSQAVLGGNSYYRNTFATLGSDSQRLGLFAQIPDPFQQIFVDPTRLIFTPQQASVTIDSSIDSLEDRASLATVRAAIGLPPVPILAPNFDLNGQLRIDDVNVDTPVGLGQRVFKDRGAEDRADTIDPRVLLITPRADDRLGAAGTSFTTGTIFDDFEIQLLDGLITVDQGQGGGVDDGNVKGVLVRLTRQRSSENVAQTLVEGTDYRFAYEPGDNTIRLTPIAGIWEDQAVYKIELIGSQTGIIRGNEGTTYSDGALTQIDVTLDQTRLLEVDSGINITIFEQALTTQNATGSQIPNIQGQSLSVFDGRSAEPVVFELVTTNDPLVIEDVVARGAVPVRVGERATASQIAAALALKINESSVQLFATSVGNRIQLRDSVAKTTSTIASTGEPSFVIRGAAAYQGADVTLSQNLLGDSIHGQSITVFDGTTERTFTLATNLGAVAGTRVNVSATARTGEIAAALQQAINSSGLQVNATVDGATLKLRGLSNNVATATRLAFALPGDVAIGDTAFKLTNFSLDVVLTENAIVVDDTQTTGFQSVDGATVTIFDGLVERTYEFDNDGVATDPNAIIVPIPVATTPRAMVEELRASIARTTDLAVSVVAASNRFRITGVRPISVTSISDSVLVNGLGEIGTSPGFGVKIPNTGLELSDAVLDGQFFTVNVGNNQPITFELDFDSTQEIVGSRLISVPERTVAATANAIVVALQTIGVQAQNVGAGFVTVSGDVRLNFAGTALQSTGVPGIPAPTAVVVPLDADARQVAAAFDAAVGRLSFTGLDGVSQGILQHTLAGDRVLIDGVVDTTDNSLVPIENLAGTSVVTQRISDKAGNIVNGSAASAGLNTLTIFVGEGFDYGDAPSPYISSSEFDGARNLVDSSFSLGATVSADADAKLPNADNDDGVIVPGSLRVGFQSNFEINVNNPSGRAFYVDAWFDWNGNGSFEASEAVRYGSAGTGRVPLSAGSNVVSVNVPASAVVGEIYARFRLSEARDIDGNLLPTVLATGSGGAGEVEDYALLVTNNPFQNPARPGDVNASGATTPLDALQIINLLNRFPFANPSQSSILLSDPLPPGVELPPFPDVNGDGRISAADALEVINILNRAPVPGATGEGELIAATSLLDSSSTSFVQLPSGVFASQATLIGDSFLLDDAEAEQPVAASVPTQVSKTASESSIFDPQSIMELDSIVDLIASDNAEARSESFAELSELHSLDELFSQL